MPDYKLPDAEEARKMIEEQKAKEILEARVAADQMQEIRDHLTSLAAKAILTEVRGSIKLGRKEVEIWAPADKAGKEAFRRALEKFTAENPEYKFEDYKDSKDQTIVKITFPEIGE